MEADFKKTKPGANVIMDFDDVLAPLSKYLYRNVRENWRIYSRWFKDVGELTEKEIQNRKYFKFIEWLIRDEYSNIAPTKFSAIILEIEKLFNRTFFTKKPYRFMEPTLFAERTLQNPLYIDSDNIRHIYIVSRNISDEQRDSRVSRLS